MLYAYQLQDNKIVGGPFTDPPKEQVKDYTASPLWCVSEIALKGRELLDEDGRPRYKYVASAERHVNIVPNDDLQEFKKICIAKLSRMSFKAASVIPSYKVENARRGNIYEEAVNFLWLERDRLMAKTCRDEYQRVEALINAAQSEQAVRSSLGSANFPKKIIEPS